MKKSWIIILVLVIKATFLNGQVNFNADSAYFFIEKQMSFGPRLPGTVAQKECALYFAKTLESSGFSVRQQKFVATSYKGDTLPLVNIEASIEPGHKKRVLLAAHWDTRPIADKDTALMKSPIPGADDGASGPAVLLEIARQINQYKNGLKFGVDIVLFDGEDQGEPDGYKLERNIQNAGDIYWCLGSQYWARQISSQKQKPVAGILLDMVGARDAKFYLEGGSMQFAPGLMKKIWKVAANAGYQEYFIRKKMPGILDDHIFVNTIAGIPMINIIHYDISRKNYFPAYHHTHQDDIDIISKETLKAVGETLLQYLYR